MEDEARENGLGCGRPPGEPVPAASPGRSPWQAYFRNKAAQTMASRTAVWKAK